jgi:hypothetical protein
MHFADLASVAANLQKIRLALGDHNNGRGPAVYGKGKGDWIELRRVSLEGGIPYGHTYDEKFVLREARVGDGKANSPEA